MAKRYMKRCSASLNNREMQIKTTMRYHLTPVRMAIIKKTTNNKFGKDMEKRGLLCTVGRMKTDAATMENCIEGPKKIKSRTTI